ncbi:MAG TPA: Gfo/Idh/MocA family oxidoreductase [Candidatus Brocadiia bacterium]|nr:Gfo/Idh/MocA family oxidoreductase [Candidatus Brocadiia bacterium]
MRILIVGCGSIGERHLRCFGRLGGVETSICDPRRERLAQLKERYNVRAAFEDWDSAPHGDFDAVAICVPAHLHIPFAVRALKSGCHVLLEKPLSTSTGGVAELAGVLQESARTLMVAYVYRAMPPMDWMKRQLEAGAIGKLLSAVVVSGQNFTFFRPDFRDIYYAKHETGGGAIQDGVTHLINLIEWFAGPVSRIGCVAERLWIPDVQVEDTACVIMRFHDAPTLASITMNQFQAPNDTRVELCGSEGNLRYDSAVGRAGILRRGDSQWKWESPAMGERDDGFVIQAQRFVNATLGKAQPTCSLAEAEHTLKACLAALESARTGSFIEVPK